MHPPIGKCPQDRLLLSPNSPSLPLSLSLVNIKVFLRKQNGSCRNGSQQHKPRYPKYEIPVEDDLE